MQNLLGYNLGFFGPDLRVLTSHPSYAIGAFTATVAMVAVVTGVVWLGGRYVIESGGFAIFVLAWFAICLACATGLAVNVVVRSVLSPNPSMGYAFDLLGAAPRVGGEWGMTYGWIPAVVALLVMDHRIAPVLRGAGPLTIRVSTSSRRRMVRVAGCADAECLGVCCASIVAGERR
ncbi:hypothetical protein [Nocardioides sp. NPDC006273]|uniref:hypothetical protein n=1 Tax=Nocardioides sp. NPDC006273 TaxID=3155598 RepID=UPI0033BF2CA3